MGAIYCQAVGEYREPELEKLARALKTGYSEIICQAASLMVNMVGPNAVLIPIPSHEGRASYTLHLARELSRLTDATIADILMCKPHESSYELKHQGRVLKAEEMGFKLMEPLITDRHVILVDNVIASGNTAKAAINLLPGATMIALANDSTAIGRLDDIIMRPYLMDRISKTESKCQKKNFILMEEKIETKKNVPNYASNLEEYVNDKSKEGWRREAGVGTYMNLNTYMRNGYLKTTSYSYSKEELQSSRFIQFEKILSEKQLFECCFSCIPEDTEQGRKLKESFIKEGAEKIKDLRIKDYRKAIEKICREIPNISINKLDDKINELSDRYEEPVHLDGKPIKEAITWALMIKYSGLTVQHGDWMLKECLNSEKEERIKILERLKYASEKETKPEWETKLNLPKGAGAMFGAGELYIFEKGVLGHAVISPDRKARFWGDSMNPKIIKWINDVMENHNIVNDAGFLLFDTPINEKEHRILDAQKGTVRTFCSIINTAGDKVLLDEEEREFHGSEDRFLDITGRITDIKLKEGEKPTVRCKIDGIQQLARPVSEALFYNYKENRITGLELAEKCFAARLIEYQQRQNQGIKR